MTAKNPTTIESVDAQLIGSGMPSYSDLLALLNEATRLGLTFHIGNAYISRAYIEKQAELVERVDKANSAVSTKD
jgi:hypothetical protein